MLSATKNLNDHNTRNFVIWCSLAFQGGAINAGGFLACHRFVSHITGYATHFGAEIAQGNSDSAWSVLSVPLFFLLGAMLSGFWVDRRIFLGKRPHYRLVTTLIGLDLLLVTLFGSLGFFGVFGIPLNLNTDYNLLIMLCLACGMQNACVTSASGAVVRTTHLTGMTTDLGIGFVRVFTRRAHPDLRKSEMLKNRIRLGLITSFLFGSLVGSVLFVHYGYLGFSLPMLIAFGLSGLGVFSQVHSVPEPHFSEARTAEGKS